MKNIMLAMNLIQKRKVLNFFLILQIFLSLFFIIPEAGQLRNSIRAAKMTEQMDLGKMYYFSTHLFIEYSGSSTYSENMLQAFYDEVEKAEYVEGVAEIYYLSERQEEYSIMGYNEQLIQATFPYLAEEKFENGEAIIPVVITNDMEYKHGEVFSLDIYDDTYEGQERYMKIQCEVVAILKSPREYLAFERAASDGIYTPDMIRGERYKSIILPINSIDRLPANIGALHSNKIIITKIENAYERVYEDFSKFGYINNMQLGERVLSVNVDRETFQSANILSVFMLLTLISSISCKIVQLSHNRRTMRIYHMLGMSKRTGVLIEIIQNIMLIAICLLGVMMIGNSSMGEYLIGHGFVREEYFMVMVGVLIYLIIIFGAAAGIFHIVVKREEIKR